MATEMNFGPQWIRDMYERSVTEGTNHAIHPTARGSIQMANHRYGYEEMVGLIPSILDSFDLLHGQEFHLFEPREPSFSQPVMAPPNSEYNKNSFSTSRNKHRSSDNDFERTSTNRGNESFRRHMPESTPDPPRTAALKINKEPPDRKEPVFTGSSEPKVNEPPSETPIDVIEPEAVKNDEPEPVTCEEIEKMLSFHESDNYATEVKTEDENDNFFIPEPRVGVGIDSRELEENAIFNLPIHNFNFNSLMCMENENSTLTIGDQAGTDTISSQVENVSNQAVTIIEPDIVFQQASKATEESVGNDPIWHYIDPRGNEQGPFSNESMSKWYDNNYFPDTLPIRTKIQKDFRPLKDYIGIYGQAPFDEECSAHLIFAQQAPPPVFKKDESSLPHENRTLFENHDHMNHDTFMPTGPTEIVNLEIQPTFPKQLSGPEIQSLPINNTEATDHFNPAVSSSVVSSETTVAKATSISTIPENNSQPRSKKTWDAAPFGANTKSNNNSDSKRGSKRNQKNSKNASNNDTASNNPIRPVSNGVEIEEHVNKFFQSFEDTSANAKQDKPLVVNSKKTKVHKVDSRNLTDERILLSSMLDAACTKEKARQPPPHTEKVKVKKSDPQKLFQAPPPSFIPSLADIQKEQKLSYINKPEPAQPIIKKETKPAPSTNSPWNIVHDSYTPINLSLLINSSNNEPKNARKAADQNFSSIASVVKEFENDELSWNNQMQYPQIQKNEYQNAQNLSSAAHVHSEATGVSSSQNTLFSNTSAVTTETGNKKQSGAGNTAAAKKNKKEKQHAKSVKNLFNQKSIESDLHAPEREFHGWCLNQVFAIDTEAASAIDIPTFVEMLKEFDSPYEIHATIKEYLGETKECQEFAAEFINRKNKLRPQSVQELEKLSQLAPSVPLPNVVAPSVLKAQEAAPVAPPKLPNNAQTSVLASSTWASANPNPPAFELPKMDSEGNRNSKKGKQRKGQKINPVALLQISSKPAPDRVKIGEIDNA